MDEEPTVFCGYCGHRIPTNDPAYKDQVPMHNDCKDELQYDYSYDDDLDYNTTDYEE